MDIGVNDHRGFDRSIELQPADRDGDVM